MSVVASFHLTRFPPRHALAAMARLAVGRGSIGSVPGLRFARQLGTGRGSGMGLGADLSRWATFAVWNGEGALDNFLDYSTQASRWRERGEESYHLGLRPLSVHGSWGGERPLTDMDTTDTDAEAPVAVLTRARIRPRHWPAFYRSVPAVETHLRAQEGLLAVLGIGEAPVGLQATFSLWRSPSDVRAFAYDGSAHEAVVRRTREEGWFAEELFARFRPYRSAGAWDGIDPLAGAGRAGGKGS